MCMFFRSILVCCVVLFVSIAEAQHIKRERVAPSATAISHRGFVSKSTPALHVIGKTQKASPLKIYSTITSNKGKIVIDGNLGEAHSNLSTEQVGNAEGVQFSSLSWPSVGDNTLPCGVVMRTTGEPGKPEIPALVITCAIPESAKNFSSQFIKTSYSDLKSVLLLPNAVNKTEGITERRFDRSNYSGMMTAPVISKALQFRRIRFITVTIPLAQYSNDLSILKAKNAFTCELSFDCSPISALSINDAGDPIFADAYKTMVANPQDVAKFQVPFNRKKRSVIPTFSIGNSTFDTSVTGWIDPTAINIKLMVTRTGLYRVAIDELINRSHNNSIGSVPASNIRFINRSKEVPIWIDTNANGTISSIEFYGERLPGLPGEYYNWDTDSNAYWLTTNTKLPGKPLRYKSNSATGNPTQTISEGTLLLHHEKDLDYYPGDVVPDETATTQRYLWVEGERFIWEVLKSDKSSITDTIILPTLPKDVSGKTAALDVFVRGISSGTISDHSAAVLVNGAEAGVIFFDSFNVGHIEADLPLSSLQSGKNTIEVQWRNNGGGDQWYFDHYNLRLLTQFDPSNDTAISHGQWLYRVLPASGVYGLQLNSTIGDPIVYDLSAGVRILKSSNVGGQVSYVLNGTPDSTTISAAVPSTFLHPDLIADLTNKWAEIFDTTTPTDYIIITHSKFLEFANRLSSFRSGALKTKVVLIDDIFNAFGYGTNEPWAIRRYLQYAYDFYRGTPPSLVTLFGDGTWDPKFSLPSTIHQSYIPTYGVPSTDYIFTLSEGVGRDSLFPEFVIARIPVESEDEARGFVDKLVEYENKPPEDWNRNFLFVSGGDPNKDMPQLFDITTQLITNSNAGGVSLTPMFARTTLIKRTDLVNQLDATHIAEIQSAFKNGQSLVYFFGHGATNITDVLFPDVNTLSNPGLYPVLLTLSCRTGAFAEPNIITMNESYLRSSNRGIIMGLGSTGFDAINYSAKLSVRIFNFMKGDSLGSDNVISHQTPSPHRVQLPIVFTLAKYIESVLGDHSGLQFDNDNSLYETTILGDAALGFIYRPQPEFHAAASDVKLTTKSAEVRSIFTVADSFVHVTAKLRNYGYAAKSRVRITFRDDINGNSFTIFDSVDRFDTVITISETLAIDTTMLGTNTLHIIVDPDNGFLEQNENDNEAVVTFIVSNSPAVQFYPPEGGKNICDVTADSVHFMLLLSSKEPVTLELQIDTTSAFTNPISLGTFQASPLFFERSFSRTILQNPTSSVIWWRAQATTQSGIKSDWQFSSVSLRNTGSRSSFSYTTSDQFNRTIITDLAADATSGGLHISTFDTIQYEIIAHGGFDVNLSGGFAVSQININGEAAFPPTLDNGIFLAVLTPNSRQVQDLYYFANPFPNFTDSINRVMIDTLEAIINALPTGRRAIVFTNKDPNLRNDEKGDAFSFIHSPRTTQALESIGSARGFDSTGFFTSYALSGIKGAAPGSVAEKFMAAGTTGVDLFDTVLVYHQHGFAEFPATMIATDYGDLSWNVKQNGGGLKLAVIGTNKITGTNDTLRKIDVNGSGKNDLSSIDANIYDRLALGAAFSRDTSFGPVLSEIDLQYDIAPEFEIEQQTVSLAPPSLEEGYNSVLRYTCSNRLCVDGRDVPVIVVRNFNGKIDTVSHHTIATLAGHSSVNFADTITTTGMEGNVAYTMTINPNAILNEQLAFNNTASITLHINRDTLKPKLDLVFDGHHINNGDYVASNVPIEIRLFDISPLQVTDTASLGGTLFEIDPPGTIPRKFLGNLKVDSFKTTFVTLPNGQVHARLTIEPEKLHPGAYLFQAYAKDASGNASDTIENEFVIAGKNGLEHVMNYPNPFKDKTFITFILRQAGRSTVRVPIYTISGRKIRTLDLDASKQRVGLNAIEWDGRDENGNDIANGTYIYKVVLNGISEDGTETSEAVMERAVRSR